jgi:hypothetical protein
MSVRPIGMGGAAQQELRREQPRRQRLGLMFLLSLGTGGVAGILAFIIIWVPTLYALANSNSPVPQLAAKTLFPPAAALHNTVNVYDPPVYRAPQQQQAAPPQSQASPTPGRSPRPTPSGSPNASPTPHDD